MTKKKLDPMVHAFFSGIVEGYDYALTVGHPQDYLVKVAVPPAVVEWMRGRISDDPELAPGGSQAQPNTAVLESGIKTASLPEEFTTYVDAAMNADAAKYRRADEPEAEPRCHCATVHYPGCEYVEWARTHLNRGAERE